eukprot:6676713-Prymnesium_polylepis.1
MEDDRCHRRLDHGAAPLRTRRRRMARGGERRHAAASSGAPRRAAGGASGGAQWVGRVGGARGWGRRATLG